MRTSPVIAGVALAFGAALADAPAGACGGCFGPSETVQVVTDHRMAVAIHPTGESYLWDQFRFTGRPEDFSWVLPVRGDVRVELASGAFLDMLDGLTAPVVQAPQPCRSGFTSAAFSAANRSGQGNETVTSSPVEVLRVETVGPYQSALIRGTDGDALARWLRSNGYAIPAELEPVLRGYAELRMDFYAMRLRPGEGVGAMQPVRIRFDAATPALPLRMIAAGAGDAVGLTLFVLADGPWETQNYPTVRLDRARLEWDWSRNASNYNDLFAEALRDSGGLGWVAEAAFPLTPRLGTSYGGPGAEDVRLATESLRGPWVTRLRTRLATRLLNRDLHLAASDRMEELPSFIAVTLSRNAPVCPAEPVPAEAGALGCSARPPRSGVAAALLAACAALAAVMARRRATSSACPRPPRAGRTPRG